MTIVFDCESDEYLGPENYQYVWDPSPPAPYIEYIDQMGLVTIKFNSTMVPEIATNHTDKSITRRLLYQDVKRGTRTSDSQNFTLINNGTIYVEDTYFPSLDIFIRPNDPEHYCAERLNFSWECIAYERDLMLVQL